MLPVKALLPVLLDRLGLLNHKMCLQKENGTTETADSADISHQTTAHPGLGSPGSMSISAHPGLGSPGSMSISVIY